MKAKNAKQKKAHDEAKEITLSQYAQFLKVGIVLKHSESIIPKIKKKNQKKQNVQFKIEKVDKNGAQLVLNDTQSRLFERQTFNELVILMGVSLFERYCKEWFKWGLKHNNKRLRHFGNKEIKIFDILKNDSLDSIIDNVVSGIKFLDLESSQKYFKKVFGYELLKNKKEKQRLDHFFYHRHIIAHNCGFVDVDYIQKTNLDKNFVGKIVMLEDKDLEKFLDLIHDIMVRLSLGLGKIVLEDLDKKNK